MGQAWPKCLFILTLSLKQQLSLRCLPCLNKCQIMHVLVTSQVLHPVIKVLVFKVTEHAVQSRHKEQQRAFSTKENDTILIIKGGSLTPFYWGKNQHNIVFSSNLLLTFPVELVNERRLNSSDAKQMLWCLIQRDWKNKYRCVLKFRETSLSGSVHLPLSLCYILHSDLNVTFPTAQWHFKAALVSAQVMWWQN